MNAQTFSILGRIERDATAPSASVITLPNSSFQYPRSDRAGCNSALSLLAGFFIGSFSILGRIERDATNGKPENAIPDNATFSILGRIERDAT